MRGYFFIMMRLHATAVIAKDHYPLELIHPKRNQSLQW